jgi:tRNA A-37 threonylcarbamoyl transferase component Bud32
VNRTEPHKKDNEAELVSLFCTAISKESSPLKVRGLGTEFDYTRGRTDVIALDDNGGLIAFEAKLEKWRGALNQAYRNSSFAHRSYIVLPESTAQRAAKYPSEFNRRSVGLCSVLNDGLVKVLIPASHMVPLQPYLTKKALDRIVGCDSKE